MLDLLIRNGTILDGQGAMRGSLAVSGSRIAARYADGAELPAARRTVDAGDLLVLPGLVDPHVHFYGEGIGGYSRLAVMGGVTTFIGMIRGEPDDRLADVVAAHVDPSARQMVEADKLWPDLCPSPLAGERLAGWPIETISRGQTVWRDGEVVAAAGRGELIRQERS